MIAPVLEIAVSLVPWEGNVRELENTMVGLVHQDPRPVLTLFDPKRFLGQEPDRIVSDQDVGDGGTCEAAEVKNLLLAWALETHSTLSVTEIAHLPGDTLLL